MRPLRPTDPRGLPHFLRVTRALAFVSGLGIPLTGACGGALATSSTDSGTTMDDGPNAVGSDDANPLPPASGVVFYPVGSSSGGGYPPVEPGDSGVVLPYGNGVDAGPTEPVDAAVAEAGPTDSGVIPVYDGALLGVMVIPNDACCIGGPLIAPELPA